MTSLAWTALGLPLSGALGLFAGLGSLVVGLYFLRVRRRRVTVPFLELWARGSGSRQRTALFSRSARLWSLLLQLLLLSLLLLALTDPRQSAETQAGRSLVFLLDVSASMATPLAPPATGTRLDRAKARARELIGGLGTRDQVLLIEMGRRPRPLAGWSREPAVLEAALEPLEVLDTAADFSSALELAQDALGGLPGAEIVVLSDGALPQAALAAAAPQGVTLAFEPLVSAAPQGEKGLDNVALTTFAARRYPHGAGGFEVLFAVLNAADHDVEVEVTISAASPVGRPGAVLELVRLLVPRGQTVQSASADVSGAEGRLMAELRRLDGRRDVIVRDNVAYAQLPARRQARVLVVGEANTFVEAALLVDPSLQVTHVAARDYPPPGGFDVTIFDGAFPARLGRTGGALYLGVPEALEAGYPLALGKTLSSVGFDHWAKADALFRFLDPYDIQILKARALVAGPGDRVLGRSDQGNLLIAGERAEGRFLALGFAPRDSDFVLRVAFPLFLLNAIDTLAPEQNAAELAAFSTGTAARFTVPGLARGRALVRGPLGPRAATASVPVEDQQATFLAERAGFYEVTGGDRPVALAASLFDAEESSLSASAVLKVGETKARPVAGLSAESRAEPWVWFLLAVLGMSLIEWITFHKRWTV